MSDVPAAADTPIAKPTFPRASRVDQVKGFIGDLARPFALISVSGSCAAGLLEGSVTADKLGLALTAMAAMYGAKAWEAHGVAKAGADVEMAKANAGASAAA